MGPSSVSAPPAPPAPPPPPTVEDPAVAEAARRARVDQRTRKGRAANFLTAGMGAGVTTAAPTRAGRLLGQ